MIDYNPLALKYAQNRRINPRVIEHLVISGKISPSSLVLEVGCGTGNYISTIEEEVHCSCWGCDPSQQMLSEAGNKSKNLHLQHGRAEKLEYPENTFDLIYTVDVIHHVSSPDLYFQEAFRVLKPGGKICTVTESGQAIRDRRPFANYFPDTVAVDLQRYPTITSLHRIMNQVGFTSISEETIQQQYDRTDIQDFRDKAYSCLHLISEEAFKTGIHHMEQDLQKGPIPFISSYLLMWGSKK